MAKNKRFNSVLVLLICGAIILFTMYFVLNSDDKDSEEINEDSLATEFNPYPEKVKDIRDFLLADGYEVIAVSASNLSKDAPFLDWYGIEDNTICPPGERFCKTNKIHVSVAMKSWGSRSAQIDKALLTSYVAFPNAFVYVINIQSSTDACNYVIFGNIYRNYIDELHACFPEDENGYMSTSEECFNSEGDWKPEVQNRLNQLEAKVDAEIERYKQCS